MPRMIVITARDVDSALILRRGPSNWFHLISWETRRDQFTHGAWIKGRIYCEICDLSPNGQLFVYSIFKGNAALKFTHAYTAVSRSPWLHALAISPQGTTYGGGGRFVTDSELCAGPLYIPNPTRPGGDELRSLKIVHAVHPHHQSSNEVPDVDWSGRDQQDRLIFTRGGCVFRRIKREDKLVADFSDLKPDPQPAPEWAKIPLR